MEEPNKSSPNDNSVHDPREKQLMFKATSALCLHLTGRLILAILCCTLLAGFARAQESIPDGQLDVPYVPTPPEVVELMLQMAQVQPDDYLIDMDYGDGQIYIAAANI